jgi:hypothetical protein
MDDERSPPSLRNSLLLSGLAGISGSHLLLILLLAVAQSVALGGRRHKAFYICIRMFGESWAAAFGQQDLRNCAR